MYQARFGCDQNGLFVALWPNAVGRSAAALTSHHVVRQLIGAGRQRLVMWELAAQPAINMRIGLCQCLSRAALSLLKRVQGLCR